MKSILDDDDGKPILYVGDDEDDAEARKKGFAILRCCKDGPHSHRQMLGYTTQGAPKGKDYLHVTRGMFMALNLIDVDDPTFIQEGAIFPGLDFIHRHLKVGDRVLVHCNAGHSRGPTVGLLFLRTVGELPHDFTTSEKVFRTLYPEYDPGRGLRTFARAHWNELKDNFYETSRHE